VLSGASAGAVVHKRARQDSSMDYMYSRLAQVI